MPARFWPGKRIREFDIEQFSGHNTPDGPPPILPLHPYGQRSEAASGGASTTWSCSARGEWTGGWSMGEPILISRKCIGLSAHSGIPSSVVSRGGKVHVVWGEATEPEEKAPGVPTFVATYDRADRPSWASPRWSATARRPTTSTTRPASRWTAGATCTCWPARTASRFRMPDRWSRTTPQAAGPKPGTVGEGLSQTYIGLVCGPDDTLHLVYRLWRRGEPPSGQPPRHARLPAQAPGPAVGGAARAGRAAVFRVQRLLPPPDDRPRGPAVSVLRLLVHLLVLPQRPAGRRRSLLMSPDGGRHGSWPRRAISWNVGVRRGAPVNRRPLPTSGFRRPWI